MDIYKQKKSLGFLRKAQKTKERSPDCVGPIKIQRTTLETLMNQLEQSDANELEANLAGWQNQDRKGQFLTVELSPKYVSKKSVVKPKGANLFSCFSDDEQGEQESD